MNVEWKSLQTVSVFLYSLEHMVYEIVIVASVQLLQNNDKYLD